MTTETEVTANESAFTITLKKGVVPENRRWNDDGVKWTFLSHISSRRTTVFRTGLLPLPYT